MQKDKKDMHVSESVLARARLADAAHRCCCDRCYDRGIRFGINRYFDIPVLDLGVCLLRDYVKGSE
jgi:hypothetical protein